MRYALSPFLLILLAAGNVQAAGIFNTSPSPAPANASGSNVAGYAPTAPAPAAAGAPLPGPAYRPVTPPQASVVPPLRVSPAAMASYDRYPNETDDAYVVRMKALSDRAVADMSRISKETTDKMRALAPPPMK